MLLVLAVLLITFLVDVALPRRSTRGMRLRVR
jgi:hypothetical protein